MRLGEYLKGKGICKIISFEKKNTLNMSTREQKIKFRVLIKTHSKFYCMHLGLIINGREYLVILIERIMKTCQ